MPILPFGDCWENVGVKKSGLHQLILALESHFYAHENVPILGPGVINILTYFRKKINSFSKFWPIHKLCPNFKSFQKILMSWPIFKVLSPLIIQNLSWSFLFVFVSLILTSSLSKGGSSVNSKVSHLKLNSTSPINPRFHLNRSKSMFKFQIFSRNLIWSREQALHPGISNSILKRLHNPET